MANEIATIGEVHVNPFKQAVKEHTPSVGDYYAVKSASYNSREIFRLTEKEVRCNGIVFWKIAPVVGSRHSDSISDEELRKYYRPLLDDFEKTLYYANLVADGQPEKVAGELMSSQEARQTDTEALMASGSREQVSALLEESERMQNKLEEIRLTADIIIENKKAELERRLDEMKGFVSEMNKKVENLVKIITVLNLYTGKTVDIHVIVEGNPAEKTEPLSLRQRILYMDEELCASLDYEADYKDVPLFFESLKEKAFRDIVIPEQRCVVAVKPKRFNMRYRSGDALYDAQRNIWNKHTYVVIRNGENLWWLESDDLEVCGSAFPHSDFEEEYRAAMAKESFSSSQERLTREHENVRYRTTKYMVFLQGLIDSKDILAPMSAHPNLMKGDGISLVRDDENLLGTGRKPWREFRTEKNATIRRGTRILYRAGETYREGNRCYDTGGELMKYYSNEYLKPTSPATGIYHADVYEYYDCGRFANGKRQKRIAKDLVFRYLPGDKIWHGYYEGETDRKKRVAWKYENSHVLNYDAVTTEELEGYLSDRTLREYFSDMMPLLKKVLLEKKKEDADEADFKMLISNEAKKKLGVDIPRTLIDDAVSWWKTKVIYSRPLNSDDAKAFRMIMKYIEQNK